MTFKQHKKLFVTLDDEQDGEEQASKKMIPSFLIYTPQRPSPSLAKTGSREEATWWAAPRVGGTRERRRQGRRGEEGQGRLPGREEVGKWGGARVCAALP